MIIYTLDSPIETFTDYKIFLKKIYKYENENILLLLLSIIITPIIVCLKIVLLIHTILLYTMYAIITLFMMIKETVVFIKEEFEFFSQRILYIIEFCINIVTICYYYNNIVLVSLSSFNLLFNLLYFFKYTDYVIRAFINFNNNTNRYMKYRFSKFVHISYNIGIILCLNYFNSMINLIIVHIICVSLDIMLHMILTYYMKYKCNNIDLLVFYDVIDRINEYEINNNVQNNINYNLEKHTHKCEENCNSCPYCRLELV